MQAGTLVRWLLTLGLAYVFLFFGIDKILRPLLWIGWIPPWFEGVFGLARNQWLSLFGVIEILLGLLLLVPRRAIQCAVLLLIVLHLVVVLSQTGFLTDIGVRDTGLLLASVALLCLLREEHA